MPESLVFRQHAAILRFIDGKMSRLTGRDTAFESFLKSLLDLISEDHEHLRDCIFWALVEAEQKDFPI